MFKTLQDRLPKELALHGIEEMETANRFLTEHFLPAFNTEFKVPAREQGSAFVPLLDTRLDDILCIQEELVDYDANGQLLTHPIKAASAQLRRSRCKSKADNSICH